MLCLWCVHLNEIPFKTQNVTLLSHLIDKAYPDGSVGGSKRSVFNCIILKLPPPSTTKETQ